MSLVVFQHVDLLGKLAVALLTLVLFDALMQLHMVPQRMLGLHPCRKHIGLSLSYPLWMLLPKTSTCML